MSTPPSNEIKPIELYICTLSIGYFFYDFACELYYTHEPIIFSFHHIFAIFGYVFPVFWKMYGIESVMGTLIGEVTGLNLSLRKILPARDGYYSRRSVINDIIFIISFTYVRIFWCEWLFVRIHLSYMF